jgi:transcriptional regulator with XRE-family HTH domain
MGLTVHAESTNMTSGNQKPYSAKIGDVLRNRRRELDLTLQAVADGVEVSKGFLSEVERDKASPSVATLVRLCDILGITIGSLFEQDNTAVVRVDARTPAVLGGTNLSDFLLSPKSAVRTQAILSIMAPGGTGGDKLYSWRSEEEFVFVVEGSLTMSLEGEEFVLLEGDAMTFDPRRLHTFRNGSASKQAQALFILSPPSV